MIVENTFENFALILIVGQQHNFYLFQWVNKKIKADLSRASLFHNWYSHWLNCWTISRREGLQDEHKATIKQKQPLYATKLMEFWFCLALPSPSGYEQSSPQPNFSHSQLAPAKLIQLAIIHQIIIVSAHWTADMVQLFTLHHIIRLVYNTVSSKFCRSIGFSMYAASREILRRATSREFPPMRECVYFSSGFAATLSLTMLANFSSKPFNSSTEASMSNSSCILNFYFGFVFWSTLPVWMSWGMRHSVDVDHRLKAHVVPEKAR